MQQSTDHSERQPDAEQPADVGRRRRLVVVGWVCFLVGLPLVSLSDGTALSVLGLCLETVAGACVVTFVYQLAGDQHDPDSDPEE